MQDLTCSSAAGGTGTPGAAEVLGCGWPEDAALASQLELGGDPANEGPDALHPSWSALELLGASPKPASDTCGELNWRGNELLELAACGLWCAAEPVGAAPLEGDGLVCLVMQAA